MEEYYVNKFLDTHGHGNFDRECIIEIVKVLINVSVGKFGHLLFDYHKYEVHWVAHRLNYYWYYFYIPTTNDYSIFKKFRRFKIEISFTRPIIHIKKSHNVIISDDFQKFSKTSKAYRNPNNMDICKLFRKFVLAWGICQYDKARELFKEFPKMDTISPFMVELITSTSAYKSINQIPYKRLLILLLLIRNVPNENIRKQIYNYIK